MRGFLRVAEATTVPLAMKPFGHARHSVDEEGELSGQNAHMNDEVSPRFFYVAYWKAVAAVAGDRARGYWQRTEIPVLSIAPEGIFLRLEQSD